jgi:hypothetical protein
MSERELINPEVISYVGNAAYQNGRKDARQDIMNKINELLESGNMSVVNGIMALQMIQVFVKYMDEE